MARAARIAFLAPRFADGATVGGAETLLRRLAERAAADGRDVTFLTTCASDHFSWANLIPSGQRRVGSLNVHFFPVDEDRDIAAFLRVQNLICSGVRVSRADEEVWLSNSVNSRALYRHLEIEGAGYDRIVAGPYLFGVTGRAARIHPLRTLLVPCLHDEAFARLDVMRELFHSVRGTIFNSEPERELAGRLYGALPGHVSVVGMGLEPRAGSDPRAFARRYGL
ncbi:MAG: glycosyltransferase, partial [bacterium]